MDSLRVNKPGLTHLDLRTPIGEPWDAIPDLALLPIIQCLNASPSPWNDRLVSLKIHRNIVVPDFLRDASKTMWPNLKTIKLMGDVPFEQPQDGSQMDEDDAVAFADKNGREVIEALIMAVPSMPKATKFRIRMNFQEGYPKKASEVSIHLGNVARTKNTAKPLPCVDTFVPSSNNGVAKVDGISLPGDLAAQLQDVVRCHRRQELEVFACTEDGHYYGRKPHVPCVQWNRKTDSWDPVFNNDMNMFIYEMGQYWEAVDEMDGRW